MPTFNQSVPGDATWSSTTYSDRGFTVTLSINPKAHIRTMLLRALGLPQAATHEQARTAYRKLAKEHHPDRGGDREEFERIQRAWETLGQLDWPELPEGETR